MRILMLTSSWPLCQDDWRGGFVADMALDLACRGHFVDVAVPRPASRRLPDSSGNPATVHENVRVSWLPALTPVVSNAFHGHGIETNIRHRPLSLFSIPPALVAYAMECGLLVPFADVIVSNWVFPMGLVGAYLSWMTDKPHLVIAHSAPAIGPRMPFVSAAVRTVVRSAKSVACVSGAVRDRIAGIVGDSLSSRLTVKHLGIYVGPVINRVRTGKGPLEVLFVGRLTALKGCDILIRALRPLNGFRLRVVGDGPDRRVLEALAGVMGVDAVFPGELDRRDVRQAMCDADILVIPSRRTVTGREEGLPRVLVEAWSAGLPVIASSTGGMTELVTEHGGGELFGSGDVAGLRRSLIAAAAKPGLLDEWRRQVMGAALTFDYSMTGIAWEEWISSACS